MPAAANFDRLARGYRALEFVAFGRDLERARFSFLERLRDRRSILVLGEGDGRCLERLVALAPHAAIHCLDASPAMIAAASARLPVVARSRVTLTCADIFAFDFDARRYDAVTTFFFLDCFTAEQVRTIVARVTPRLEPGALWLFADFVLPARGWPRRRAQAWLALLYAFFRWQTGLRARALPPSELVIEGAGFARTDAREWQHGLLRSAVWADRRTRPA